LEVAAVRVALGRECLQIQVVWVWPVGNWFTHRAGAGVHGTDAGHGGGDHGGALGIL
jgi:hypothetical protein